MAVAGADESAADDGVVDVGERRAGRPADHVRRRRADHLNLAAAGETDRPAVCQRRIVEDNSAGIVDIAGNCQRAAGNNLESGARDDEEARDCFTGVQCDRDRFQNLHRGAGRGRSRRSSWEPFPNCRQKWQSIPRPMSVRRPPAKWQASAADRRSTGGQHAWEPVATDVERRLGAADLAEPTSAAVEVIHRGRTTDRTRRQSGFALV